MFKQMLMIGVVLTVAVSAKAQNSNPYPHIYQPGTVTFTARPTTRDVKLEKATYLGVATESVSPALREQLKLKPGVGLLVDRVEDNSPAEQAGVKQYDILEKLDDQLLINSDQFMTLIRMHESGNEIKLSIIRQSQPQVATAKLIEKEVPVMTSGVATLILTNSTSSSPGTFQFDTDKVTELSGLKTGSGRLTFTSPDQVTFLSTDSDHALTLTRNGKSLHLNAVDQKTNNLLYDGPIDTDEDWKAVPPDVATKAHKLADQMNSRETLIDKLKQQPDSPSIEQRMRIRRDAAQQQPGQ